VDWTGWVGIALGLTGVVILTWTATSRTPSRHPGTQPSPGFPTPAPMSFAAYQAGWREAHLLGEETNPGGWVAAAYLRLPYLVGAPLARAGVDPDLLTLAALWIALVAGWTATLGPGWAAAAGTLTLAAGIADSVDGAVAVLQGRTTDFGFVWDSTADRLADLAVIAGPVVLVASEADPGWGAAAVAAGTAAAGLLLLLEYVRARAQAGQVPVAWSLVTPGERPTRVIVLGLTGLAVGVAQLGGDGLAGPALDAGYPLALAVLAVLEAVGCGQLLLAAAPGRCGRLRPLRRHKAPKPHILGSPCWNRSGNQATFVTSPATSSPTWPPRSGTSSSGRWPSAAATSAPTSASSSSPSPSTGPSTHPPTGSSGTPATRRTCTSC
jgi:phosphatidylglycerophosphate synthase